MKKFSLPAVLNSSSILLAMVALQACGGQGPTTAAAVDQSRISLQNRAINLLGGTGSTSSSSSTTSSSTLGSTLGTNAYLTLNASVASPNGEYADDVFVQGINAYVSYNTPGNAAGGAVDQINVTVPALPVRIGTFTSASDINGTYVDLLGNVYAVGGDGVNGSTLQVLTSTALGFGAQTGAYTLPSYTGTAVKVIGSSLYTLTGSTGGLNIFSTTGLVSTTNPTYAINDARGFDQSGTSNLWVISGGGVLSQFSTAGALVNTKSFTGANNIPQSKSGVHVGTNAVAVSLGSAGTAIVCMSDLNTMATIPALTLTGVDPTTTVANSVTFGNGQLFIANGAAGVTAYTITNSLTNNVGATINGASTACGQISLTYQGYLDLGNGNTYSANGVYMNGTNLYIALGLGGLDTVTINVNALGTISGLMSVL